VSMPAPSILCEAVWVTVDPAASPAVQALVEPLTHLLAAAVARSFGKATGLYTVGASPATQFQYWLGGQFTPTAWTPWTLATICGALPMLTGLPSTDHRYVFFVDPANPTTPPALAGTNVVLDRIVYVTLPPWSLSGGVPHGLGAFLKPGSFAASDPALLAPLYTSFIPSMLVTRPPSFSPSAAVLEQALPWTRPRFDVRPVVDDWPGTAPVPLDERLNRDACNLRFDVAALTQEWQHWTTGVTPAPSFLAAVASSHRRTARRWARAVTNRRVGVCVAGGGASAYRAGPVLREMRRRRIPVDVFAGDSGGALVAGHYCSGGRAAFRRLVRLGPWLSAGLPIVITSTWPAAFATDWLLDGERIESLERRFVPVTTKLDPSGLPAAAVVVNGTVGQGVRASGCLPPSFAPTAQDRVRYTDGSGSAMLPSRILQSYGADVMLACDILPGPKRCNPFDQWWLGRVLHDCTPAGRLIDLWAMLAFFSQRATRAFGEMADAYVRFQPQAIPLFESAEFFAADTIVQSAASEGLMIATQVSNLQTAWHGLW